MEYRHVLFINIYIVYTYKYPVLNIFSNDSSQLFVIKVER